MTETPLLSALAGYEPLLVALAAVLAAAVLIVVVRAERARRGADSQAETLSDAVANVATQQAELAGRLRQLGEGQASNQNMMGERLQAQERLISQSLERHLEGLSRRVGEGLGKQTEKTQASLGHLQERLAVIDAAQRNIADLSAQMVGFQEILSNKQARGAFGEIQLNDLVKACLPPSAYEFQATLNGGKRVDCLLKLPNPPGAIGIDAKFPLESYVKFRDAEGEDDRARAARSFSADVLNHVKAIASKYIVPGETADSALMFLPSEAVYAELHATFRGTVEASFRHRVWIVSPTTMMATLNTVRAVLKDVHIREQASAIQAEVEHIVREIGRLDGRSANLQRHFEQVTEDLRQIRITTEKVVKRGDRIRDLEVAPLESLGENGEKPGENT